MMALCPEGVDMKRFRRPKWYTKSAAQASADLGRKGTSLILAHMREALGLKKKRRTNARIPVRSP